MIADRHMIEAARQDEIDLLRAPVDRPLTLEEVARVLTPGSDPVSEQAVRRWIRQGIKRRGHGQPVKLIATQLPAGRVVMPADLARFVRELQGGGGGGEKTEEQLLSEIRAMRSAPPGSRAPDGAVPSGQGRPSPG